MPTLKKIVSKASTKSCELDPLSTKLLKQSGDVNPTYGAGNNKHVYT